MKNKLEAASNIAIILLAILVGGLLLHNHFSAPVDPIKAKLTGSQVDPKWYAGTGDGETLLLVLSTSCSYCEQSTPFYRQLATRAHHTRIVAAFMQPKPQAQAYIAAHQIPVSEVMGQSRLVTLTSQTPSLLLLDRNGKVLDVWLGKLPPEEENRVFKKLT